MPNPFYTQTQQPNLKDMYNMFSRSNNPMQLFMNMAGANPDLQPVVNALKMSNNPQAVFNQLCQQRGINPQEFLKSITG